MHWQNIIWQRRLQRKQLVRHISRRNKLGEKLNRHIKSGKAGDVD